MNKLDKCQKPVEPNPDQRKVFFDTWVSDDWRGRTVTLMQVPESYFKLSEAEKEAIFDDFVKSGESAKFEIHLSDGASVLEHVKTAKSRVNVHEGP